MSADDDYFVTNMIKASSSMGTGQGLLENKRHLDILSYQPMKFSADTRKNVSQRKTSKNKERRNRKNNVENIIKANQST